MSVTVSALRAREQKRSDQVDTAWSFVRGHFRDLDPDFDIVVRKGMPAFHAIDETCVPLAFERAASSRPGVITIHPSRFDLTTAAGVALLAHELEHQMQFQEADSIQQYAREQRRVKRLGLPPWENRYEWPAYKVEAEVYHEALAAGLPPGKHRPLLISQRMAAEGEASNDGQRALVFGGATSALVVFGALALNATKRRR